MPAVESFRPQMVFVSAGFDDHVEDPAAEMMLVDGDYIWLTQTIMNVAREHAQGRIVSCLEGGYALEALGRCVCAHVRMLAGL
jgi:acetoin utilization deacetylase AcuC-like enzyme